MGDAIIIRRGKYLEPPIIIDVGLIIMWYGLSNSIPTGWALCDGTNGTPNLIDNFIIGAGDTYNVGDTGGSLDAIVSSHTHTVTSFASDPGHAHGLALPGSSSSFGTMFSASGGSTRNFEWGTDAGLHSHSIVLDDSGSDGTNQNIPPYYSLFYIIKEEE